MRFSDYLKYALGALMRIKVRSSLTIAGVMIGIAASVLLVSFGEQAKQKMVEELGSEGALKNITVISPRVAELARQQRERGKKKRDPDALKKAPVLSDKVFKKFKKIRGVDQVFPSIFFNCVITRKELAFQGTATDLNPDVTASETRQKLKEGEYFSQDDAKEMILTEYLAYQLIEDDESISDLVGQEVMLNYFTFKKLDDPKKQANPFDRMERKQEKFEVVGVLKDGEFLRTGVSVLGFGYMQQDTVILPHQHAERLYGERVDPMLELEGGTEEDKTYMVATLTIDDSSPENVQRIRDELEAMNYPSYHIYDMLKQIKIVFGVVQAFLGALGLIALLVAALQIINTMTMSILERTREIGVMKAVGARNRDVRRLFVTESILIGTLGALLGVGLAWLVGRVIEWGLWTFMLEDNSQLEEKVKLFTIPMWLFGIAMAFGVVVSLLAAIWPAHRAARIDPVKALRRE